MKNIDNPYTELLRINNLKRFLENYLRTIIRQEDIPLYVDENAMNVWVTAFTHETYDPSNNYENLEYLGDRVLKSVFPKYLMKRFPQLHKNDYTELDNIYMSKIKQSELATKMGLGEHLRYKGITGVILNLKTDVFESFFGALDTVSDAIAVGLGAVNSYNMIAHLFADLHIKVNARNGPAKTQVDQIFSRFDLPKPRTHTDTGKEFIISISPVLVTCLEKQGVNVQDVIIGQQTGSGKNNSKAELHEQAINAMKRYGLITIDEYKGNNRKGDKKNFSVELTNEHLNFLRNYGIILKKSVIGEGVANTKKEAEVIAYDNALETLSKLRSKDVPLGITRAWADAEKQNLDFRLPEVIQYVRNASEKASKEGFKSFYFFISRKTANNVGAVVQLVGVRPDEKNEVLSYYYTGNDNSGESKNNYQTAKALVLKQYINSK